MIESDNTGYLCYNYYSHQNRKFELDEEDWIIFSIDKKKSIKKNKQTKYWLKQITIKNANEYNNYDSAVKEMRIEIGNINKDKWIICQPNPIKVKKNDKNQTFNINCNFDKNLQDFKIIFISNHSKKYKRRIEKFVVNRLRLKGV